MQEKTLGKGQIPCERNYCARVIWKQHRRRQKHAAYVFGFIEEERYESVACVKAP